MTAYLVTFFRTLRTAPTLGSALRGASDIAVRLFVSAMLALVTLTQGAAGLEPGARTLEPVASSTVYGRRFAVVVALGRASDPASEQAEASAYARRLQELGFAVTAIGPSRRFDADATFRDLAIRLPPNSEVALVITGPTYELGGDLFLAPEDMPLEAVGSATLQSEALSLSLLLRSIQRARPSKFVGIITDCRFSDRSTAPCPLGTVAGSSGASLMAAVWDGRNEQDRRVANAALLGLMTQEGLTFAALYDRFGASLGQLGAAISRSPELSTSFMFTPQRFFESLDHDCNRNATGEISAEAAASRLRACEIARRDWPYADHFLRARIFAQEQGAFAAAAGPCSPTVRTAISQYRSAYRLGAFAAEAERREQACREPPPPPVTPPRTSTNPADAFQVSDGVDFPENDIDIVYDVTIDTCMSRCSNTFSCQAFTYNTTKNRCFLKSGVTRVRTFREAISGVKRTSEAAQAVDRLKDLPSYDRIDKLHNNVDMQNYGDEQADYQIDWNATLEDCRSTCEHDRRCRAFTFNVSRRACILKSSVKRWAPFSGAISGKKY